MAEAELAVHRVVGVPAEAAWTALVDWPRQREWMLGTRVWVVEGDGASVGSELVTHTGVGDVGFVDTMRVTEWHPPHRCEVRHTGRLLRGRGVFQVRPRGADSCLVSWTELFELPLGRFGAVGWRVLRPVFAAGARASLRRFAALVGTRSSGSPKPGSDRGGAGKDGGHRG